MISTGKWQVVSAISNIEPEPCVSTSIAQTLLCAFVLWRISASDHVVQAAFRSGTKSLDIQWHISLSAHVLTLVGAHFARPMLALRRAQLPFAR